MIVHAYPARSNAGQNPFNRILSDALERHDCAVQEPRAWNSLSSRADIVLLNWPQAAMQQRGPVAVRRTLHLLATMTAQRRRGAHCVWIVHNSQSHDSRRPRLERRYMRALVSMLSGAVYLTEGSRAIAQQQHPGLRGLPFIVMPHPVYGAAYPHSPSRAAARSALGLTDRPVTGLVGDLKAYKGVDDFLAAFLACDRPDLDGLIAGAVNDPELDRRIDAAVSQAGASGRALARVNKRLGEDELVQALAALDLLALPYKGGENSGMAMLAAERGTPILASANPATIDLQASLGTNAVATFEGTLSGPVLATAVTAAAPPTTERHNRFVQRHAPAAVAGLLHAFFSELVDH